MNYSTAIFLISDDVRCVETVYEATENAPRARFKTMDTAIKVDDFVVVPSGTRHNITTAKVVAVDVEVDLESSVEMGWVVGVVAMADFDKIKSQEGEAIATIKSAEKRRKKDELREAILKDVSEADLKALPIYTPRNETEEDAKTDPA